jgi:hypothetical protein
MTPTFEMLKLWFTPVRETRFWRKVDKRSDGCWLWTGSLTDSGHGRYDFDGETVRVHRLTWILARQRDIPDWMVIRHFMCHNERCCNPAHLVGGTQGENVRDIWLVHKPYDDFMEQEAIAAYMECPYIGGLSDRANVGKSFLYPSYA